MPQSILNLQTPTILTCGGCPKFNQELNWCKIFDNPAKAHHMMTADCLSSLDSEINDELTPEEDRPHCQFSKGDIVKVIEQNKKPKDWQSFEVAGVQYNSERFRSDESSLTEPEFYVLIATARDLQLNNVPIVSLLLQKINWMAGILFLRELLNQLKPDQFWVSETDICLASQAHNVETAEVF